MDAHCWQYIDTLQPAHVLSEQEQLYFKKGGMPIARNTGIPSSPGIPVLSEQEQVYYKGGWMPIAGNT